MDPDYEQNYHSLEERQWWFVARREIVLGLIGQMPLPQDAAVLEVGCSTGPLLSELQRLGLRDLSGIDISASAIAGCAQRGLPNCHVMDAAAPELPAERFDLIIASDVLEHLQDDRLAVENWLRLLRPGGHLVVFVPAYQWLWSDHDRINHHFRRYTRGGLCDRLRAAGWDVESSGYWNAGLLPPVAVIRWFSRWWGPASDTVGNRTEPMRNRTEPVSTSNANDADSAGAKSVVESIPSMTRRKVRSQLFSPGEWLNALLIGWLRVENWWLLAGGRFPAGISTFAIATRPRHSKHCARADSHPTAETSSVNGAAGTFKPRRELSSQLLPTAMSRHVAAEEVPENSLAVAIQVAEPGDPTVSNG